MLKLGLCAALILGAFSLPAEARCGPRDKVMSMVTGDKYKEQQTALGVINDHSIMEVYANPDGTSWTFIISRKDGTSCIISHGKAFQSFELDPHEVGEPS